MTLTIDSVYEYILTEIKKSESESVDIENITITENEYGEFVASAFVIPEVSENLKDDDDISEYLEAREEGHRENITLSDEELHNWSKDIINTFDADVSCSTSTKREKPSIRFVSTDNSKVVINTEICPSESSVESGLQELKQSIDTTSDMVPSEESLRTMTVRLTDFAYDEEDWSTPHHDFTIYFATESPHEYWANCETIEDYFEMVAENNDEMTVEEMQQKDEYYSHTHLMHGKGNVVSMLESFTTDITEDHITVTEDITVFPHHLEVDFETSEVTLKCDLRREIAD
jgi:hypothetical protein